VRFMLESGARASEVVGLATTDVDLARGQVVIRRGKGGMGRVVPIGPQTAIAIGRYMRARRHHRLADSGPPWVGGGERVDPGEFGLDAPDRSPANVRARSRMSARRAGATSMFMT